MIKENGVVPADRPAGNASSLDPHWYTAGENTILWIRDMSKYPQTPTYILERLSHCTDSEIRMAVGDHPNTSLAILWDLSHDIDVDVRFSLAENHNLDTEILAELSLDTNPYVACRAVKTLARLRGD